MAKVTYYLYNPTDTIERKRTVNGKVVYEFYRYDKGWQIDDSTAIQDALHGYGDYSPMDVDEIPEKMAMKISNLLQTLQIHLNLDLLIKKMQTLQ